MSISRTLFAATILTVLTVEARRSMRHTSSTPKRHRSERKETIAAEAAEHKGSKKHAQSLKSEDQAEAEACGLSPHFFHSDYDKDDFEGSFDWEQIFSGTCSDNTRDETERNFCQFLRFHQYEQIKNGYDDPFSGGCSAFFDEDQKDNDEDLEFDIDSACCACGGGKKTCRDTHNTLTDAFGASCDMYNFAIDFELDPFEICGNYDKAGFHANDDCCGCGGGIRYDDDASSLRPLCGSHFYDGDLMIPAQVFRNLGISQERILRMDDMCQLNPVSAHFASALTHYEGAPVGGDRSAVTLGGEEGEPCSSRYPCSEDLFCTYDGYGSVCERCIELVVRHQYDPDYCAMDSLTDAGVSACQANCPTLA